MNKRIISNIKTNYNTKFDAFPYQYEAFLAVKDLNYSAIFHEQGLGKTKIALDLMLYWLQKRDIDTVMIVTKKQLVSNWIDEFQTHTYILPKILSNNKIDNFYVLNSPAKAIIANFETLSTDKERIKLFLKCRNVAIIIDESTKLKNPNAKITQDYFELSRLFKIKTIMTGTPVANRPYDIWAQIYFLDQGKSLGDNFNAFKRNTDLTNKLAKDECKRQEFEKVVVSIYDKISKFAIRETKKNCNIDLPNKVYKTIYGKFSYVQSNLYYQIMNELQVEVEKRGISYIEDDSVALKRLLRLNQITSNPRLIDDSYKEISGKEKMLEKLLIKLIEKDEKCIVWSCFIDNIDYFTKIFKQFNPIKIHGNMSIQERNKSVYLFKNDLNCKVLFATPQTAKEGLTLTVANNVIFYDRGFNLDDYLQAQDRIHRISQRKTCYVYNLMIEDSIDYWVNMLLEAKQNAAFLAQGDISLENYSKIIDYSYGEIIKQILMTEGRNFNE